MTERIAQTEHTIKNIAVANSEGEKNIVDRLRKPLSFFTRAIIVIGGTGVLFIASPAAAAEFAGTMYLGGMMDEAADQTLGKQLSIWWNDLKTKVRNVYGGKQGAPQANTAAIN